MSHTSVIEDIVFTDIEALQAAVRELKANGIKCDLVNNQKPRAYYENQQGMNKVLPYVLQLHDARFDVGFEFDAKLKGFVARTDLWAGSVAKVLGATPQKGENESRAALGKLYSTYAVHATTRKAAQQGYTVQRHNKPDGTISLTISGFK